VFREAIIKPVEFVIAVLLRCPLTEERPVCPIAMLRAGVFNFNVPSEP
jgi:hypothetical protein